MPDKFVHPQLSEPGNQIRLLRCPPGARHGMMEFEMSTWSLSEAPEFSAISYRWGDTEDQAYILVNRRFLQIRKNCCYALWQADSHQPGKYLWVDSICISQSDAAEKSMQVGMMGKIFAKADCVLACVGPHEDDSEFLIQIGSQIEHIDSNLANTTLENSYDERTSRQAAHDWVSQQSNDLLRLALALAGFHNRWYWQRLWIVQEIACARKIQVLCGDSFLTWGMTRSLHFIASVDAVGQCLLKSKPKLRSQPLTLRFLGSIVRHAQLRRNDSVGVLSQFNDFGCADVRDRTYATLGLVNWGSSPPIRPDYTLSHFQLAIQLTRNIPLSRVPFVQRAFRIDSQDWELREAIQRRRAQHSPKLAKIPFRNHSVEFRERVFKSRIESDGHGGLTTNLYWPDPSRIPYEFDKIDETAIQAYSAQRLTVRNRLAALSCSETRAGDVILANKGYDWDGAFLVIRRRSEAAYDIIGQGFVVNGYQLSPYTESDKELYYNQDVDDLEIDVDLALTDEDVLLLVAQDKMDGERGYDLESRLGRLVTPVTTGSPRGAVRIRKRFGG